MNKNLYLNIVCTVIAIELLLLVLKQSPIEPKAEINAPPVSATQVRYNIPNVSFEQPEPITVKIVGIELPTLKTNRNALPVLTYNPTFFKNGKVENVPLQVQSGTSTN